MDVVNKRDDLLLFTLSVQSYLLPGHDRVMFVLRATSKEYYALCLASRFLCARIDRSRLQPIVISIHLSRLLVQ